MKRTLPAILLAAGALLVLGVTALATQRGMVRVPPGRFGIARGTVLSPGWHLVSPFARAEILPAEGDGALPPLPVTSREGVRGSAVLSFRFRVRAPVLARASRRSKLGFHDLLEDAASSALAETLSKRSAAEFLDRAGLDPPLTDALVRSLAGIGVGVSDLKWEIRLPEEFRRNLLRSEYGSRTRHTGIRVLLIGLDAADWEILDSLMAAGRLPNLKRLVDAGVRAPLRSYNPMISPMLWTTVATGKGPDLHGVADFSVVDVKTGNKIPISDRYRKVKAIWNILSDFERSSVVVGWWASYPAERLDGYLVSDRVAALSMLPGREKLADRPGYTFPASVLKEILPRLSFPANVALEEVRRFADVGREEYQAGLDWIAHPPAPPRDKKEKIPPQDPVGLLIKILTATRNYQTAALDLLGRGPFDFGAVYFEGIDLVGHRFQHYLPPKMAMVGEGEYRKFHRVVTEFYAYQDRLIGELLEKAGPGVTVLVLSDHGFKSGGRRPEGLLPYTMDQPVEWHREDGGIFILSGPGAGRGRLREPVTLFDVAPTLLALLGLPVASDMPGRVLAGALEPGFLSRFPPGKVPTYEGVGAPRETQAIAASDEVSAEMMAQLRALGYVGGDVHAPGTAEEESSASPAPATDGAEDTPVTYHRNLATYYLSRKEYAPALAELEEANRREKLPKTYAMMAECLDALGKREEALAEIEEGWKELPQGMEADSIFWYVQLAVDSGDPERAEKFLEERRESLKDAPAIREAAEGRIAEARGRPREAERLYETALAADPTLVGAAKQLVNFYRREGRMEAIRPVLEAGLRKSERIDEYHNLLGALDSAAGDKEAALSHFRRAAELSPGDPRFPLNLGLTLMDLQRWDEAERVFEKAAASMPDADLFLGLGNVLLRTRKPDQALTAFQKAREMGGSGESRADLGITLSYLGLRRPDEALAFARESLSRNPANPPLRNLYQELLRKP